MQKSTKVQCILQHNPRRTQTEQMDETPGEEEEEAA